MDPLDQHLNDLIEQARQHPPSSFQRRRILNQIVIKIQNSGRLYKTYDRYYPEALSKTWVYFIHNVCEATTAKSAYDPNQVRDGSVITWLNVYLKFRLKDEGLKQQQEDRCREWVKSNLDSDETTDPVDQLPSPISNDIEEPDLIATIQAWVEADSGETLGTCHPKDKPQASCKTLIAKRLLPPETTWKVLAEELSTSIPTLQQHFQRHCLKLLQAFCREQGYHD
jgi:hypothetical protein